MSINTRTHFFTVEGGKAASGETLLTEAEEPTMWQRFTERARRVVFFAQEEAGRLRTDHVSTEHLLLGVLREEDTVAARILTRMGFQMRQIREELLRQVVRCDGQPTANMQLTPRSKRVVDLAYDESRNLNNNYIGTEHLLLGLIREGEGLAGRVLTGYGIELERTREEVIRLQAEDPKITSAQQTAANAQGVSGDYTMGAPFGYLGVAHSFDGRATVDVAMDATAFGLLVDIFVAKDAHGYRAMTEGDQTVFLMPTGTPLKALVPPIGSGKVALSEGRYVRVLEGDYAGYAGWVFRECFASTGPDDAPFPPPTTPTDE